MWIMQSELLVLVGSLVLVLVCAWLVLRRP